MTAKAVLSDLVTAYQNEKCTKTLLPYASALVDHFLSLVHRQTEFINSLEMSLIRNIYELEVERVKYFVKEYIQTRLRKINSNLYVDHSLLSEGELVFYKKYIGLLKEEDIYIEEQRKEKGCEFVGFYCLGGINGVKIDGNVLEVFEGDFLVAPLDDVLELLKNNEIVLF